MIERGPVLAAALLAAALATAPAGAQSSPTGGEPPVVPVGLDAYRQWDRWPYQRIGVRAYMRSTYDRTGGNDTADASHFLYQEADDFNVTLDVAGAGRPLLRALQPLARQPLALRGGRHGPHRPGDQHRRSAQSESGIGLPAAGGRSRTRSPGPGRPPRAPT